MTKRASDVIFYTAYGIWLFASILNTSLYAGFLGGGAYVVVRYICLASLLLCEVGNARFTLKEGIGFLIACIIAVCALIARDSSIIDYIAFVVVGRSKDLRRIADISLRIVLAATAFVCVSSFVGIIPNYSGWSGGRIRMFLGFRYALYSADFLLLATFLTVYLLADGLRIKHVLLLLVGNTCIYYFTTSRLSYYLALVVLASAYVIARVRSVKAFSSRPPKWPLRVVFSSPYIIGAALSFWAVKLYASGDPFIASLDNVSVLGGRLAISLRALQSYGISLFGREMHFFGAALDSDGSISNFESYDYIDCLYIKTAINYGIVFLVLFVALQTAVMWRVSAQGNPYLMLILAIIAIHCVIDSAMVNLFYNTFLFLMGELMISSHPHKPPDTT